MIMRILGAGALTWGIIVFLLLSTATLPSSPQMSLPGSVEFGLSFLSIVWLISSLLVKVGLIMGKKLFKVSIISCLCFVMMLINMGLVQASFSPETSDLPNSSTLSLFNLVALWFVSWLWIDLLVIILGWRERRIKKQRI